jgi:hypothetical protein
MQTERALPLVGEEPARSGAKLRRWVLNAFIGLWLTMLLVTGLPSVWKVHESVREPLARALASVGMARPKWRLFAPNVHKLNSYIVAEIDLDEGSRLVWSTPEWRHRTLFRRFSEGQLPKFYDNLRRDRNRAAWRPFAAWVVRRSGAGADARAIRLERRFWEVPPPASGAALCVLPPREAFPGRYVFYEKRLR